MTALAPAFALHRATKRPPINPTLSAEVLCEVSRVSCSFRIFRAPWGRTPAERKAIMDGRRISHEAVERNKRGNSGKHREQPIKHHPGSHGQQSIVVHLLIHAPKSGAPVGSEKNPGRTGVRRSGCGCPAGTGCATRSNPI